MQSDGIEAVAGSANLMKGSPILQRIWQGFLAPGAVDDVEAAAALIKET